jgi:hypothetical protein
MKRILFITALVALVLAGLLSVLALRSSNAAQSAPQCPGVVTPTDADGQGSIQQYRAPEFVYINGAGFPANTALSYTVTHGSGGHGTVVASGSFQSDPDGTFSAFRVWDGFNSFVG